MITGAMAAWMMASIFSDYPAFLKKGDPVEAYIDRGAIIELIVRCPVGTGIMSYSKIERLYCSSKHNCSNGLHTAVEDTCR